MSLIKNISFLLLLHPLLIIFLLLCKLQPSSSSDTNFTFNGFKSSELILDGVTKITSNGLIQLTNYTVPAKGHAFYPTPIHFKPNGTEGVLSFSTSFVFAIQSESYHISSHGIVFIITPKPALPWSRPSQYLGLFNESSNGNSSNHVFGVEFDTIESDEVHDINNNHVGIDINSVESEIAAPVSYFLNSSSYKNLTLWSGQPLRVWVEYNGAEKKTSVTVAPIDIKKPKIPLLILHRDLSPVFKDDMYVGFSSATGSVYTYHYILAWSFALNGSAAEIDISNLPKLPRTTPKRVSKMVRIGVPAIAVAVMAGIIGGVLHFINYRRKFAEEMDDWESEYGPHRFRYKDLYIATKGFKNKGLLGTGGFGRVYRGNLLDTYKTEIAVKKVSHESRQGIKEFVAEIVTLGRLRHRNLVQLLGYCRRKGELLLVYDYMPNGSLDKYLHHHRNTNLDDDSTGRSNTGQLNLDWKQRFKIIKGVASGLLYLHEEWEQVVIHRDIKASNVLLDSDHNGRLGDFGLARLYDHGSDPQTTHVVGTLGYLAPEQTRTGRATRSTDVFAFGAFLLEVACGRRPIEMKVAEDEEIVLVDWVFGKWKIGQVLSVMDPRLEGVFHAEEAMTVLNLGMMCLSVEPGMRPTMREVIGYLEGVVQLPELEALHVEFSTVGGMMVGGGVTAGREGFSNLVLSSHYQSSMTSTNSSSITKSVVHEAR